MPIYTFKNRRSGKTKEYTLKLAEYDKFKEDHPELERVIDNTNVVWKALGNKTVTELAAAKDPGWKEVLAKIGQQNPDSQLNSDYTRNKTVNRLKAESIVEKHVKKQAKERVERAKRK